MTRQVMLSTEADAMREARTAPALAHYLMHLYITGVTLHSVRAVTNIRKICEEHLKGRYDLEVTDIALYPELAVGDQIIAAPTLIKTWPLPVRRFVGDMSRTDTILIGLNIDTAPAITPPPNSV